MRIIRRIISMGLAAGLLAGALGTLPAPAQDTSPAGGLATPEDAVRAYLQGVADADAAEILAASAVDQMATGMDFTAYVERLQAWGFFAPAPATHPLLTDFNLAQQQGLLLGQAKMLIYGLLTDLELDGSTIAPVDAAWADALVAQLDLTRLAGIEVGAIAFPLPDRAKDERILANAAKQAAIYGADELTERMAEISLEGRDWLVGFTLLRYGDVWLVSSQTSALGGTPSFGTPLPAGD